jgi:hypothetical protein
MFKPSLIFWRLLRSCFTFECSEKSNTFSRNELCVVFYGLDYLYDTVNDSKNKKWMLQEGKFEGYLLKRLERSFANWVKNTN